ncbi:MAG: ABC transporter permease [Clostridiales Family XIII bacterium]|jgi:peptide/nickel transport system permease protein|nr:ABC transporter permease [Clostridiales Family XIII bacterium]
MIIYVIKRLLMIIPVLLCVAIIIFTIMHFAPGDPVALTLGDHYTPEQYAATASAMGLDRPFFVQLAYFLKDTFIKFDFGTSYFLKTNVKAELLSRLPRTAAIASICCLLQVVVSIPLGVTAATHQNGIVDRLCIVLAMICISVPGFWIGMMLMLVFSLNLGWLPSSGVAGWQSYILPCLANAFMGVGGMTRLTRSQMLEVIRSDYVVTARAKGVPERAILYSHALPNALIPIITYIGTHFGAALGGTVVIETVFSIPGIGYYMIKAVGNRDYPIVRGGVTLLALLFCLVILFVDILYAFIDPRIKAQYENSNKRKKNKTEKEATANV